MAMGVPSYKVVLCGDYGVGKSSLFRRFVDNSFTAEGGPKSTMGLDSFSKTYTIHGRDIKLEVWDTAGIERFATLAASYYHSAAAAILCYSAAASRDASGFPALPQHLLEAVMNAPTVKIFLVATQSDRRSEGAEDVVTEADVARFEEECDAALSGTFVTSSRDGTGVADMFHAIAESLISDDINKFRPKPPPELYTDQAFRLDAKKSGKCCS